MANKMTLTPCQWASISRELSWNAAAFGGKGSAMAIMIEEAIAAYSILDNVSPVEIELDDGQTDLLKRTVKYMLGHIGDFADHIGLNDYYKLP